MRLLVLLCLASGCASAPGAPQPAASASSEARTPAPLPPFTADSTASMADQSAQYLASVAAMPGVERGRDGVLWTVTEDGAGMRATRSQTVRVEYTGRLPDGTVFDATPPGQTADFPIRGVVPGLQGVLQEMRPGERRTVYIPPAQGYAARGVRGANGAFRVPPGAVIVFDLKVVRVLR